MKRYPQQWVGFESVTKRYIPWCECLWMGKPCPTMGAASRVLERHAGRHTGWWGRLA